jgi:glycosyltransferase involved in cell wall biosynthesis
MLPVSVIILTFNSAETIGATLASVAALCDDVHVVDSGSADATIKIARGAGAQVASHPFENYGAQRNWAIASLPLKYAWQLHLDADERVSDALATELSALFSGQGPPPSIAGYYIPRLVHFHRQPIRHGGMWPIYHLRLFRAGCGHCEARKYDQHFYVDGQTAQLAAPMIDDIRLTLAEWSARHNRWADAEVDEILSPSAGVIPGGDGTPVAVKRAQRHRYYQAPLFWRAFGLFFYRYVVKRGFLDGRWGLIFFVLQTFWFRFLVDAKLYERMENARQDPKNRRDKISPPP